MGTTTTGASRAVADLGLIALLLSSFRTREIIIKIIMIWIGIGMMMIGIGIGRIALVLSSFKTREIKMIGLVIGNEDSALWLWCYERNTVQYNSPPG